MSQSRTNGERSRLGKTSNFFSEAALVNYPNLIGLGDAKRNICLAENVPSDFCWWFDDAKGRMVG